jgi:hypothetical protein
MVFQRLTQTLNIGAANKTISCIVVSLIIPPASCFSRKDLKQVFKFKLINMASLDWAATLRRLGKSVLLAKPLVVRVKASDTVRTESQG